MTPPTDTTGATDVEVARAEDQRSCSLNAAGDDPWDRRLRRAANSGTDIPDRGMRRRYQPDSRPPSRAQSRRCRTGLIPGEDNSRLGRQSRSAGPRPLTQYLGTTARLPYLQAIVDTPVRRCPSGRSRPLSVRPAAHAVLSPLLLELIHSYWLEEGMLIQSINAISRRFQNIRGPASSDPLSELELDPLRTLNNLLWGYIQDEQHRLTVVRRAYEYKHHSV